MRVNSRAYATDAKTSLRMARIRSVDTKPELLVRRLLWHLGYRYRLHGKSLPGKPDIVMASRRVAIFVHGCFWHRHNCPRATIPERNEELWTQKFQRTIERDRISQATLADAGWSTFVVWECETKDSTALTQRLISFLDAHPQIKRNHSLTNRTQSQCLFNSTVSEDRVNE